eukprot:Skav232892  [mRNA]  locus=scaffold4134:81478:96438:+ [translate_table: standard]
MTHFLDVRALETCDGRQGRAVPPSETLLELFPVSFSCLQLRPKTRSRRSATSSPCKREEREEELQMKPEVSQAISRSLGILASPELQANLCSILLQTLTPLAAPMNAGATTMAFCPFPLCGSFGSGLECAPPLPELSLQALQRGLLVATFLQGSLGLLRICLGDFFSGSYTLLLATLGYNSRHPGPSSAWLKTYVLISFINGTMGHIDLMQNTLLHNFPALQLSLPISVNLMHTARGSRGTAGQDDQVMAKPTPQNTGFHRRIPPEIPRMMLEAYQREWMMMMERPPWPPPPLIPLPQLPGQPGVPLPPGPAPIAAPKSGPSAAAQ